jgi:single-strand DNA-binding protein
MRDIASATLSGNLTRDVDLRALLSGTDVARLRIATTTRRRNGEQWIEKTNYFTVEVYGSNARACGEHLGKGSRIVVDAELDWREWTDQQSNRREAVTLRARQVLFEGGRPRTDGARTTMSVVAPQIRRSPPSRASGRRSPRIFPSKRHKSDASPPSSHGWAGCRRR